MSEQIFQMARAIAPRGQLRRCLPTDAPWRKSIGADVILMILMSRPPAPWQLEQLSDTCRIAEAIAVARQAEAAHRRRRPVPVLYSHDPAARRWRRRSVPIAEALIGPTEGSA
jgi:hypothetical protein